MIARRALDNASALLALEMLMRVLYHELKPPLYKSHLDQRANNLTAGWKPFGALLPAAVSRKVGSSGGTSHQRIEYAVKHETADYYSTIGQGRMMALLTRALGSIRSPARCSQNG